MTTRRLPMEVGDLTAGWFAEALGRPVTAATVLDRHSGTTGRVRVALDGDDVPPTVFVKLPPFDETQRQFVNAVGMGVVEARLYRDLGAELPVRVPGCLFADAAGDDHYVMVLEDLEASGCRFPAPDDADIADRARDIVEQMARLHARFWETPRFSGDLAWIAERGTGVGDGGAGLVQMAVDRYGDRLTPMFSALAERYVAQSQEVLALYARGAHTVVHGDPHLGNLFVDGADPGRTGFLDWAMVSRAPGIRDVAYVLCNSIPRAVRVEHEDELLSRYCAVLAAEGARLDAGEAHRQYRLFAVYSWVAATATLAMGSKWQPEHIGLAATERATSAIDDLRVLDLLDEELG